jgi:hypothetical protein
MKSFKAAGLPEKLNTTGWIRKCYRSQSLARAEKPMRSTNTHETLRKRCFNFALSGIVSLFSFGNSTAFQQPPGSIRAGRGFAARNKRTE